MAYCRDNLFLDSKNFKNIISEVRRNCRSAIVIDAVNGEILFSYNADRKIFPASLTKMMTAYIVFDAINKGIIGINDESMYAKKNNDSIVTIKNLIYKMIVNSSNIVTDVLAREVSFGSIKEFITQMNDVANKIGMKDTNFSNTNGLYDESHYSTVRDLAKLSIRLVYDFPQYVDFFKITNYIDDNGSYNTKTTKIQDNTVNIDGGKTGYINASGYNIAVWKKYNSEHHIFIILSGLNDTVKRDELVMKLTNLYSNNIENYQVKEVNTTSSENAKKIFDFIGFNYDAYVTPMPIKRQKRSFF